MRTFNKTTLLLGTLLSTTMIAMPATAQVEFGDAQDDEIVVTGSRIQRSQDFIANSPVATVEAIQFERTGSINTEQLLNILPQTVPGLGRTSNNPGNGTATVDLRGLGANRTLVLVNGRRAQPTGAAGVVDINTIPPSLLESVEVVTGGQSTVYGADAVAGVVNFILKDDFEGAEFNVGFQATDKGDAESLTVSATVGGNFADDRGNAVASVEYTDRSALFQGDRDFSTFAQFDDGAGGLFDGGSSGIPQLGIFNPGFGGFSPSTGVVFNPDGSIRPFETAGDNADFYNYAPVNYIQLPQERYSVYAKADFEINEHFEPYIEGRFVQSEVPQQLAPTPIFQTATFSLDNNPFITRDAQQVISDAIGTGLDTDGDGVDDFGRALLRRRLVEVGPRVGNDTRNTFQAIVGLRGDIDDRFSYDVFYSEGRTNNSSFQEGNVNRDRFNQALILQDADNDGNVDGAVCADQSSNGATVGCAPLNIFGQGNISEQAAAFLRTAVSTTDETLQRVLQGNLIGDFGEMGFVDDAPIGFAVGAEYIENAFEFRPSQDVAASTIAGFNGAPPVSGDFNVYSAYGEIAVPLLRDVPFFDTLNFEASGRVSDFSTAGTEFNYRVGGDWGIVDALRIRGNYATAVRAPNIGELFSPQGENFPGAVDPCAANGNLTQDAALRALCIATGVPTNAVFSVGINPASGQVRSLTGGNPTLEVETAKTFTIGAVISPDLFDGFTASVDYFDITIDDAIGAAGGGTSQILQLCYGDPVAGGAGSAFCDLINRRADGTIDFVTELDQNIAERTLNGVDVALQFNTDTDFIADGFLGDLFMTFNGTYTIDSETTAFDGATPQECAGAFGVFCDDPLPDWSHYMVAGFQNGSLSTQFGWQYLGAVDDDGSAGAFSVPDIGDRSYFNASITADLNETVQFTFGANNLLDTEPPILGDNQEQANTFPASYDVFGRTFFANLKTTF